MPCSLKDLEVRDATQSSPPLMLINEPRFATDFSIRPRKLRWIRQQKSGGPESKSPTLDFSKVGLCLGGVQSGLKLGGRIEGKSVGADHAFD